MVKLAGSVNCKMFWLRVTRWRTVTAVTANTNGGAPRAKNDNSVLCKAVNGKPSPNIVMPMINSSKANTVTMNNFKIFWMLLTMRVPSFRAKGMAEKESPSSTIAATLRVALLPLSMAMPILAFFSDSTSLTPSPIMATYSPEARRAETSASFCCGEMRPNTVASTAVCRNSPSLISASSGPDTALRSPGKPACRARAATVWGLSPEMTFNRTSFSINA